MARIENFIASYRNHSEPISVSQVVILEGQTFEDAVRTKKIADQKALESEEQKRQEQSCAR